MKDFRSSAIVQKDRLKQISGMNRSQDRGIMEVQID